MSPSQIRIKILPNSQQHLGDIQTDKNMHTYLTFYKDVKEVFIRLFVVISHQVAKYGLIVVLCQTKPWQITEAGPLVIETAAL